MGTEIEQDDGVCYRHPGRQSWVLCDRCGRTICAECQLQAPGGIYCPECIRETTGAPAAWAPVSGAPRPSAKVTKLRRRPKWVRWLKQALLPDSGAPIVSWTFAALAVVTSIVSLFVPIWVVLIAMPGQAPWELWRFFTSALVSLNLLSLAIGLVFFLIIGPTVERFLGRLRFLTVLLAGAAVGASAMLLAGSVAFGLTGAMYGMFAAYFVFIRRHGAPTTQFVIIMAINVVVTLVLSPIFILMLVGGLIGGGGAAALFAWHDDRSTRNPALPYWQIAGGVAAFMVAALVRIALMG